MKRMFFENSKIKRIQSEDFNYFFNKETGFTAMWGRTKEEDPQFSPVGPLIADIEISTVCNGIGKDMSCRKPCPWCYKSNTGEGHNMSYEFFSTEVFPKLPKNINQIAFGIGDLDGNPDLFKILWHCRDNGVIPNLTTNGMGLTDDIATKLANVCGAIAVSHYHIPDVCFDAVAKLNWVKRNPDSTLQQVNIHKLLAEETFDECLNLIKTAAADITTVDPNKSSFNDPRLTDLNAIVFLLLKPKGDRNNFHGISDPTKYDELVSLARKLNVRIGMDSCSAPLMLKTAETLQIPEVIPSIEPCESTLFSIYINTNGEIFSCSFAEGTSEWKQGIKITEVKDFLSDVWFSEKIVSWRDKLLNTTKGCTNCSVQKHCRACPIYDITPCKEK